MASDGSATVSIDPTTTEDISKMIDPTLTRAEHLQNAADVRDWFRALWQSGWNFHPEDTFTDMVGPGGAPAADPITLAEMDRAMDRAYDLVSDPCAVILDIIEPRYERGVLFGD
jgi:hypothetical protein